MYNPKAEYEKNKATKSYNPKAEYEKNKEMESYNPKANYEGMKATISLSNKFQDFTDSSKRLGEAYNSRFLDKNKNYINEYRSDTKDAFSSYKTEYDRLRGISNDISNSLSEYSTYIGKDKVSELQKLLDENNAYLDGMLKHYQGDYDYYSQFKDKAYYDSYLKRKAEDEKYSAMSSKEIEAEIDRLTKERDAYKKANGGEISNTLAKWVSNVAVGEGDTNAMNRREDYQNNLDTLNDYEAQIEKLNTYRTNANIKERVAPLDDETLSNLDVINEYGRTTDYKFISDFLSCANNGNKYTVAGILKDNEEIALQSEKKALRDIAYNKVYDKIKAKNPNMTDEEIEAEIEELRFLRQFQVNAEIQATETEGIKDYATKNPGKAFAVSRIGNAIGWVGGLTELYLQRDNPYGIDTNAQGYMFNNASTSIDQRIQLDHDWNIDTPIGTVDGFDILYNVGTGVIDNTARMLMSGGNPTISGGLMGLQVLNQGIMDGKSKGYSDSKALTLGLLQATFEAVTEKASIEVILGDGGNLLKKIAKSFFAEGSEEVSSNWLNNIADYIANGNHSENMQLYNNYISSGYTESQALAEVVLSVVGEDVESFLVGGLTGAFLGGGVEVPRAVGTKIATNSINNKYYEAKGKNIISNDTLAKLTEMAQGSGGKDTQKYLKLVTNQATEGNFGELSNRKQRKYTRNVGKLYDSMQSENRKSFKEASTEAKKEMIENALKENGITDTSRATEVILKSADGKKLTRSERNVFNAVEGKSILDSVVNSEELKAKTEEKETEAKEQFRMTQNLAKRVVVSDEELDNIGGYDIADKVSIDSTGEEVDIVGVSSVDENGISVDLSNGETLPLDALRVDVDTAYAMQSISALSKEGILDIGLANSILTEVAKGKIRQGIAFNPRNYVKGIVNTVRYGSISAEHLAETDEFAKKLDKDARKSLYEASTKLADDRLTEQMTAMQVEAEKNGINKKGVKGIVKFDGVTYKNLNPDVKAQIDFIATVITQMGLNVEFFESPLVNGVRQGENGSYNSTTGTVRIDIAAGLSGKDGVATLLFTAAHELTHVIKVWNPEAYNEFAKFLMKEYKEANVSVKMLIESKIQQSKVDHMDYYESLLAEGMSKEKAKEKASKVRPVLTRTTAWEEVVCDSCQRFLADGKAGAKLVADAQMNKSLKDKILKFIKDFKDLVQKAINTLKGINPQGDEAKYMAGLESMQKLCDMWDKMLLGAAENIQKTGTNKLIVPDMIKFNQRLFHDNHDKKLASIFKKGHSVTTYDALMGKYKNVVDMWDRISKSIDSDILNEWNNRVGKDRVFEVFKKQLGYKYNVELASMCKKGIPLFEAIDNIVNRAIMSMENIDMIGYDEKQILYSVLKNRGFDIPCAICYVEQSRQREGIIISRFLEGRHEDGNTKLGWNEVLHSIEKGMEKRGVKYTFPSLSRDVSTDAYSPADLSMDKKTQDAFFSALIEEVNKEINRTNEANIEENKKIEAKNIQRKTEGKEPKNLKNLRPTMKSASPQEVKRCLGGSLTENLAIFKNLFMRPQARFLVDGDLLYSSQTITNLKKYHKDFFTLYNRQGGQNGAKTKERTEIYYADILKKKWDRVALREDGGLRNQSNSDFQMYTFLDQCQMYIDLTAQGYYLHAYTKVLEELKLFGLSNAKINASLIPKVHIYVKADGTVDVEKTMANAGLDKDGNLLFDDFEGINHTEAFMLVADENYSKSIATICIGYSDAHIQKLLDDNRIGFIIGYHDKSDDTNKRYVGAKYSKNYNELNEAIDKNGKVVPLHFSKFLLEAESKFTKQGEDFVGTVNHNGKEYSANDIPRFAADLYLEYCADHEYTPAYSRCSIDFSKDKNYYKLLADFGLYDSKGNYAPHKKVNFVMPESVPYLAKDGTVAYQNTEEFIEEKTKAELSVRDRLAEDMDNIVDAFVTEVKKKKTDDGELKLQDRDSTERRSAVRTPVAEIYKNLSKYSRSDLESIAEELFWGIDGGSGLGYKYKSTEDLKAELFDVISDMMSYLTPEEANSKKFGLYVRPVNDNLVQFPVANDVVDAKIAEEAPKIVVKGKVMRKWLEKELHYCSDVLADMGKNYSSFAEWVEDMGAWDVAEFILTDVGTEFDSNSPLHNMIYAIEKKHEGYSQSDVLTHAWLWHVITNYVYGELDGMELAYTKSTDVDDTPWLSGDDDDIRYQDRVTPEQDAEYLELAKNPEKNEAKLREMVEEAAKKAGYNSPKLYHGTARFGFTKIKTSGVETGVEWSPFFATNNIYTALTYSGVPNKTEIGKKKRPKKSFGTLRDEASMLLSNGENATTGFVDAEYRDSYIEQYGDIMDEGIIRMIKAGVEGAFAVNGSEFKFVPYEDGFTAEDYDSKFGNYGLYAKTEGFLVIDGENREWNKLHSEYGSTTRLIAKNAHDDGYKGVIIRNVYDTGWNWDDSVDEDVDTISDVFVFFNPESQIKSADLVTYDNNGNIIPLSERFNEGNDDIRYQARFTDDFTELLESELEEDYIEETQIVEEDFEALNELLKLQKQYNELGKYTPTSVKASASQIAERYGITEYQGELEKQLKEYYAYISKTEDLQFADVYKKAEEIAKWIRRIQPAAQRDERATEILKTLRGKKIYFAEKDKAEAEGVFGTFDAYRKYMFGKGIYIVTDKSKLHSDKNVVTLADAWDSLRSEYGYEFNEESDANMPAKLVEVVQGQMSSINMDDRFDEAQYERDITNNIYDSYWRVSTLKGLDTKYRQKVNRLKRSHKQALDKAKEKREEQRQQYLADKQRKLKEVREQRDRKLREYKKHTEEVRQNERDRRNKSALKTKIKGVVKELEKLEKGGKNKNVKYGMKDAVEKALTLAGILLNDNISNEDILNRDITDYRDGEKELHNEWKSLTEQRERLKEELEALNLKGTTEGADDIVYKIKNFSRSITEIERKLSSLIKQEKTKLNKSGLQDAVDSLARAYASLKDSKISYIKEAYNEHIADRIARFGKEVVDGKLTVADMSEVQLAELYEVYKSVLHTVRDANKIFVKGKKEDVDARAQSTMAEVKRVVGGVLKEYKADKLKGVRYYVWNELKPVFAFKRIGSEAFEDLFWELRRGEDVYSRDVEEAVDFITDLREKYNANEWDEKKTYEIKATDGRLLKVNLQQLMSLYAYARREQAIKHIMTGGIVFDNNAMFKHDKYGNLVKMQNVSPNAYRLNYESFVSKDHGVVTLLTPDQKAYVEEMQTYLSKVMGAKGNEVSRAMYGIDQFKEEAYIPIISSDSFLPSKSADEKTQGYTVLKNSGFTKDVTPNADNPVVLREFEDIWGSHVNQMSSYHAYVLPIEALTKVYRYSDRDNSTSVRRVLESAYGNEVNTYLERFIRDLNGDVASQGARSLFEKCLANFKMTSVAASTSTVIQQPTAIVRAMALINPKYFVGLNIKGSWDECKKYCPIAFRKEMGGFDSGVGHHSADVITQKTYKGTKAKAKAVVKDKMYRDNLLMLGASKADEIGWGMIWEAVKKEVSATTSLNVGSDEFFQACADRFNKVIVETQVYDSTISRSGYMRSSNALVKMSVAFFGEPTTSVNMMFNAVLQLKRGNIGKLEASRTIGAVVLSIVFASAAKSLIYALRDDDEDESYGEKYVAKLTDSIVNDLIPTNSLPFLNEITNMVMGYDVERMDVALLKDVYDSVSSIFKDDVSTVKKMENVIGSIGNVFGIPLRNIIRTFRESRNAIAHILDDNKPTKEKLKESAHDVFGETTVADMNEAYDKGDSTKGKEYFNELLNEKIEKYESEGYSKVEAKKKAESSIQSSVTSYWKERYIEAYRNKDSAEMLRIRKILQELRLYKSVADTCSNWIKNSKNKTTEDTESRYNEKW